MSRDLLRAALLAALLLGLAACVSPEALRQQDEAACLGYGFQRGTTDFAACLQRESLARRYGAPEPWYGPPFGVYGPGWHPMP